MTLIEIENLPFTELKSRYQELVDAAKQGSVAELAERFVAARMDAKQRDEKLAEQGRTINVLNDAAEWAKQRCSDLNSQLQAASAELLKRQEAFKTLHREAAEERQRLILFSDELAAKLADETARADRLKAEATRANDALTTAEKALKDAVASRQLDAVEKGES